MALNRMEQNVEVLKVKYQDVLNALMVKDAEQIAKSKQQHNDQNYKHLKMFKKNTKESQSVNIQTNKKVSKATFIF